MVRNEHLYLYELWYLIYLCNIYISFNPWLYQNILWYSLNYHEHCKWHFFLSYYLLKNFKHLMCTILSQLLNKMQNQFHKFLVYYLYGFDMTKDLQWKCKLVHIVCFHQSMSRWGNKEPRNNTHLISLPRNCLLLAQFGTTFQFCSHEDIICFVSG